MKVVLRLPRPMENHNGRLRFTPSAVQHHHDNNRHSYLGGSPYHTPHGLTVSIPLAVLDPSSEQDDSQTLAESVATSPDHHHHHHHHKHKKHKKHKKHHHHHHDSAHLDPGPAHLNEDVKNVYQLQYTSAARETKPTLIPGHDSSTMTVAPLRIQVPKTTDPGRTSSKHKLHLHSDASGVSSEKHSQAAQPGERAFPGGIPSGKHLHTHTSHKHHHKHKEKRHEHSHHRTPRHSDSDFNSHAGSGVSEYPERGQGGTKIALKFPGGKPTAFLVKQERTTLTSDEYSMGGRQPSEQQQQHGSHEGHKHHKKKKKKKHKHSRHSLSQSEPEVSPTLARISDTETDDSRGYLPTPPSTETKSFTHAHLHPQARVTEPQELHMSSRVGDVVHSASKPSRRLSVDASGVQQLSLKETQRSGQDRDSNSSRLPLKRLSQESKTNAKLESPDLQAQPPPPKKVKMESSKMSPLLLDISQTRVLETEMEIQQQTPSPPVSTYFQPTRQPLSHGSADTVTTSSTSIATPSASATDGKPRAEARRSSIGDKSHGVMAPSSPLTNLADVKTPQGIHVTVSVW